MFLLFLQQCGVWSLPPHIGFLGNQGSSCGSTEPPVVLTGGWDLIGCVCYQNSPSSRVLYEVFCPCFWTLEGSFPGSCSKSLGSGPGTRSRTLGTKKRSVKQTRQGKRFMLLFSLIFESNFVWLYFENIGTAWRVKTFTSASKEIAAVLWNWDTGLPAVWLHLQPWWAL